MKLEEQVCSLEVSQELDKLFKELGVKVEKENLFWWAQYRHGHNQPNWEWTITDDLYEGDYDHYRNQVQAFTVGELIELLPTGYRSGATKAGQFVCYKQLDESHSEFAETEADARGKMVIYCIKNKLVNYL